MGGRSLGLGWSLFGYRRSTVIKLIEERDARLMHAESRVHAAEARVGELEKELETVKAQNARQGQHLELLRGQMVAIASRTQPLSHYLSSTPQMREEPAPAGTEAPRGKMPGPAERWQRVDRRPGQSASQPMVEELARVLSAAEEGAARIIHRAAITAQDQLARSTKAWEELRGEAAKVASWGQSMVPVITTVRSHLGEVRARIDDIPNRIQEALAPLAAAMTSIQESLVDLSSVCRTFTSPDWISVDRGAESPNGQVEPDVIRVPEAASTRVDQPRDDLGASEPAPGWMRATVGF
jgi:uncharacterized coiled-coil protein SlyX